MPCGSTTCNSSKTLDAASLYFPDLGWFGKHPLAWLADIMLEWDRRSQYGQLLELDDWLLADMGLERTAVEKVRRSRLYLDAWRDSR
jgi:uncharacterized protein YjiS (DUF1127 family)